MKYLISVFALALVTACGSSGNSPAPAPNPNENPDWRDHVPTEEEREAAIDKFCAETLPTLDPQPTQAVWMCECRENPELAQCATPPSGNY